MQTIDIASTSRLVVTECFLQTFFKKRVPCLLARWMREEGGLYVHDLHFLNGDAYCRYVPTMEFEPRKPTALVDIAMELFCRRR